MEQQGTVTYLISEGGRPVAQFTSFPQTPCVIDGIPHRFTRDGTSRFWCEGPVGTTGVAHRLSTNEVLVSCAPHELHLLRPKRLRPLWELRQGERVVGSCRQRQLTATGDLPEHLPLPVRVFAFYVVTMVQQGGGVWNFSLWA